MSWLLIFTSTYMPIPKENIMRPKLLIVFLIGIGTLMLGTAGGQDPNAQTLGLYATTLLRTDAAGTEGRLWNISTVELASGAVDARDSRQSSEVVYVLEGTGSLEVDGKPPVALKPGTVVQLAPKHHPVLTNTSLTQTLKFLVVDVIETGQPRLVLASRETRQQKECQPIPNGDLKQQKTNEQNSTMKEFVF